jgi:hypothetical protein
MTEPTTRPQITEPRWRTVLNWGAVVTFFTIPLIVFVLHVISEEPGVIWLHFNEHLREYVWLDHFYGVLTALVFGLAGLDTTNVIVHKHFEARANNRERPENGRAN